MKLAAFVAASLISAHLAKELPRRAVHVWGNGEYHARPDSKIAFDNFTPKRVTAYDGLRAKDIFIGENHEVILTQEGQVFLFDKQPLEAYNQGRDDHARQGRLQLSLADKVLKVGFTKGYIFALTVSGEVFQWAVTKQSGKAQVNPTARKVEVLKDVKDIATGNDHFLCLTGDGQVFAMGDDSYGQCGTNEHRAHPFPERRVRFPSQVKGIASKVKMIACGAEHSLAVDESGGVLGWGSNASMQLSQQRLFSSPDNPLLCSSTPIRITKNIQNLEVKQLAGGEQFTVISGKSKTSGETEIYSVGLNLQGQLGTGVMSHVSDVNKIDDLSNYSIKDEKGQPKQVEVELLRCGLTHCLASLSVGAVMAWGGNEFGQQGNRKRTNSLRPQLVREFSRKKVVGLCAGHNSSAVIVEQE